MVLYCHKHERSNHIICISLVENNAAIGFVSFVSYIQKDRKIFNPSPCQGAVSTDVIRGTNVFPFACVCEIFHIKEAGCSRA